MTPSPGIPIRFFARGGPPRVEWCCGDTVRFTESFFRHTVERLLTDPFHLVFRRVTPAAVLKELPPAVPAGLVFHVSHCGSTLVARMLAAGAGHRVLSEPDPLDALLRFPDASDEEKVAWLRGLLSAWSAPGERLFVKLEGPSTLDLPLLSRAFPETPRVFLYRDPLEVLVANLRAGGAMWPGNARMAKRAGISPDTPDEANFGALVLARYFERALDDAAGSGSLLVRWEELPEAFFTRILPHVGVAPSPGELAAMRRVALVDAKSPGHRFVKDADGKRREAPAGAKDAVERHVRLPFTRLEVLRERQVAAEAAARAAGAER